MPVVDTPEQLPVAEARAGSADAWDVLFRRYRLPLYVYVMELLQEHQTSLDVVQETFINAAQHLNGLREDGKFGGWLFGIAHQKCIQQWRRQNREETSLAEFAITPPKFESAPDDLLIRHEQEAAFMTLINQLPLPQRSVLLLHYLEDFALEQIAVITDTPLGTVKSRLHYARIALRKSLEQPV